ncbi:MAG: hypothetical protein V7K39_00195 [Nostoc sp.]
MEISEFLIKKWLREGAEKQAWGLIIYMDRIEKILKPCYVMERTEMPSKMDFYSLGTDDTTRPRVFHNITPAYSIVY